MVFRVTGVDVVFRTAFLLPDSFQTDARSRDGVWSDKSGHGVSNSISTSRQLPDYSRSRHGV